MIQYQLPCLVIELFPFLALRFIATLQSLLSIFCGNVAWNVVERLFKQFG
jgi:hypothetical protein